MKKFDFDNISDLCDFYEAAGFGQDKIEAVLEANNRGISMEQIQIIARPKLTAEQIMVFVESAEAGIISSEALEAGVKKAEKDDLDVECIDKYCTLIEDGESIENAMNRCTGEFLGAKEMDTTPIETIDDRSIEKIRTFAAKEMDEASISI